jgi:hypothetical protein
MIEQPVNPRAPARTTMVTRIVVRRATSEALLE